MSESTTQSIVLTADVLCTSLIKTGAESFKNDESRGRFRKHAALALGNFTMVHSNQDLTWCVKVGVYMGFWDHRGFSLLWPLVDS